MPPRQAGGQPLHPIYPQRRPAGGTYEKGGPLSPQRSCRYGIGIAKGYATIGAIGFEGRWDYGAIGTVTNLAARLCGEAKTGQILIPLRLLGTVEELIEEEPVGELALKGFHVPVRTQNVLRLKA